MPELCHGCTERDNIGASVGGANSSRRHSPLWADGNITNADDIPGRIRNLKARLTALDRERSDIAEQLGALEHAQADQAFKSAKQVSAPVTMASPTAEKIALFRNLFVEERMSSPVDGRMPRLGKRATRRHAATSGSEAFAESRGSNVANAPIRHLCRSGTISSARI